MCLTNVGSPRMGQPTRKPDSEKKVALRMATTVIIPARNEEKTIGPIVKMFSQHLTTRGNVYVFIDADSADDTGIPVWENGGCAVRTDKYGKGQVVRAGVDMLARAKQLSSRIILCDGDYTGLTTDHITRILTPKRGMVVGVPDFPVIDVPEHVIMAWPQISGFRCLPVGLIPEDAHGYLLETQLNLLAIKRRMLITKIMMPGLISPFQWPLPPRRMRELQRDRDWGTRNGYL